MISTEYSLRLQKMVPSIMQTSREEKPILTPPPSSIFRVDRAIVMITKAMVRDAFADSIAPGSRLTHDGSPCHNLLVSSVPGLVDDWHKYVKGDREYEEAMRYMNLLCSYLRFEFEKHKGIKAAKIEAYATLFCYRFSHVRKHGLEASIDFLFGRVCGARKSHTYRESFRKSAEWST